MSLVQLREILALELSEEEAFERIVELFSQWEKGDPERVVGLHYALEHLGIPRPAKKTSRSALRMSARDWEELLRACINDVPGLEDPPLRYIFLDHTDLNLGDHFGWFLSECSIVHNLNGIEAEEVLFSFDEGDGQYNPSIFMKEFNKRLAFPQSQGLCLWNISADKVSEQGALERGTCEVRAVPSSRILLQFDDRPLSRDK